MGNWKNRDKKLQKRYTVKQERKFYGTTSPNEIKRREKKLIREQRQEKQDEADGIWDDN